MTKKCISKSITKYIYIPDSEMETLNKIWNTYIYIYIYQGNCYCNEIVSLNNIRD